MDLISQNASLWLTALWKRGDSILGIQVPMAHLDFSFTVMVIFACLWQVLLILQHLLPVLQTVLHQWLSDTGIVEVSAQGSRFTSFMLYLLS